MYRAYPPAAVRVVRFVKRAQELGFTLADVEAVLELADGGPESCTTARAMATDADKIADLQTRIADLQAIQKALARLARTCE